MNPLNPFADLKKVEGTWDRGVDYELAKAEFERKLRTEHNDRRYSNWATLLIQLVNGSRVSEAVDAWNEFLKTGTRDLTVRVRKHKRLEHRRMIIPSSVEQKGIPKTPGGIEVFAIRHGFNTHSLRYSFVGYMGGVKKEPPQVIAKITHHKKLDRIVGYTQQKVADDLLKKVAT